MLQIALALLGTTEVAGAGSNPVILGWAAELGVAKLGTNYTSDSIPWCGLAMGIVAQRAGKVPPKVLVRALAWASFGEDSPRPSLGDVLVFTRSGGGHVGLYVGEDATCYHVLGGNQGNRFCIARVPKKMLYDCRRPTYTNQPANVRPIQRAATGKVETNLA